MRYVIYILFSTTHVDIRCPLVEPLGIHEVPALPPYIDARPATHQIESNPMLASYFFGRAMNVMLA